MDWGKISEIERTAVVESLWRVAYEAVADQRDLERLRQVVTLIKEVIAFDSGVLAPGRDGTRLCRFDSRQSVGVPGVRRYGFEGRGRGAAADGAACAPVLDYRAKDRQAAAGESQQGALG